jgi:hypothetical protein
VTSGQSYLHTSLHVQTTLIITYFTWVVTCVVSVTRFMRV